MSAIAGASLPQETAMTLKREAVLKAVRDIKGHAAWSQGLGVQCMSSALKPECVLVEPTVSECAAQMSSLFKYDDEVIPNPKNTKTSMRLPCAIANWGVCSKGTFGGKCVFGTGNMYNKMQELKITRAKLPIVCTLQIGQARDTLCITDTLGKGTCVFLIYMENVEEQGVVFKVAHRMHRGREVEVPVCSTSQLTISNLLQRASAESGLDPSAFSVMKFVVLPLRGFRGDGNKLTFKEDNMNPIQVVETVVSLNKVVLVSDEKKSAAPFSLHTAFGGSDEIPDPADDDDDDDGKEESVTEKVDAIPSGRRLGLISIDRTTTTTARCWVCLQFPANAEHAKLQKDDIRLWWRNVAGKCENSMRPLCFTSKAFMEIPHPAHWARHIESTVFATTHLLEEGYASDEFRPILREVLEVSYELLPGGCVHG